MNDGAVFRELNIESSTKLIEPRTSILTKQLGSL